MDVWYSIHRQALRCGFDAELRTHLVNTSRSSYRKYCKKKHVEFFRVLVRATSFETEELIDTEILSEWRRHVDNPRNFMTPEMHGVLRLLGQEMVHGGHKCFFVTISGLMGLAPNGTRRHDVVCILRGCDVPVMLRRNGMHFELVGACYVAGFMHGQFHDYAQRSRISISE